MCHNTNDCIVTGGAGLASRHSAPGATIRRSTALRHGAGALRHARQRARQGLNCDTIFCIVTEGRRHGVRHSARHGLRHGQCALQHGQRGATTRRPARGLDTMRAQLGFLRCSPNPVLTQDTVLSHCLDHCS